MPELAEVEYYRRCWDPGLGEPITQVQLHAGKRIFRGIPLAQFKKELAAKVFQASEARGKQLLFRFSGGVWLGLHLGMTGRLSAAHEEYAPGPHDHLVLHQPKLALVFTDARLFGRVRFHVGEDFPEWWSRLPPAVNANNFRKISMTAFLSRHRGLPIKAALLLQSGFPGVGNWMADEILWRARVNPLTRAGDLSPAEMNALWRSLRWVCRGAMRHISPDFSDPPPGWLFHERWERGGRCPRHRVPLRKQTIGGRTTAWCSECQG